MHTRVRESDGALDESRTQEMRAWPKSERPRERLFENGPQALSTIELIALLISHGHPGKTAIEMATELLGEWNWTQISPGALIQRKGFGPVKAARILAAIELSRRWSHGPSREVARIRSSADVFRLMQPRFAGLTQERFLVIAVDIKNRPILTYEIGRGSADGVTIQPKDVFVEAIRSAASGVICVHNHPSGDAGPSAEDRLLTRRLQAAAKILGLRFLDHVIVGDGRHYSFTGV